jgi:hypothetical protein
MGETTSSPNRRGAARKRPKSSAKIVCVNSSLGLGPNIAVSILDVSETGIRLVSKRALEAGNEVEVSLEGVGQSRTTKILARVIWCAALADGNHCVGARFQKPIAYGVLQSLAYI